MVCEFLERSGRGSPPGRSEAGSQARRHQPSHFGMPKWEGAPQSRRGDREERGSQPGSCGATFRHAEMGGFPRDWISRKSIYPGGRYLQLLLFRHAEIAVGAIGKREDAGSVR